MCLFGTKVVILYELSTFALTVKDTIHFEINGRGNN
jgi:hypothetical protein